MKPDASVAAVAAAFILGFINPWTGGTVRGANELRPTVQADRWQPDADAPNELRLVEPAPLRANSSATALRVHPAAQPESTPCAGRRSKAAPRTARFRTPVRCSASAPGASTTSKSAGSRSAR